MAKKVLAVLGSYRRGGMTAQAVNEALAGAREAGAGTELVTLLDAKIEFCTNCRGCMQDPGQKRGLCPLNDDMGAILDKLEAADGVIFGAPVNCFNVNALTRRFMERMAVYGYWPWGAAAPKYRTENSGKKAALITSTAMPAFFGRFFTGAVRALKYSARGLGAEVTGVMFTGLAAMQERQQLTEAEKKKARALGRRLAE